MTQNNTTNPGQTGEDKQANAQPPDQGFPPELGERSGQPRLWTLSRIEGVIGSIA